MGNLHQTSLGTWEDLDVFTMLSLAFSFSHDSLFACFVLFYCLFVWCVFVGGLVDCSLSNYSGKRGFEFGCMGLMERKA